MPPDVGLRRPHESAGHPHPSVDHSQTGASCLLAPRSRGRDDRDRRTLTRSMCVAADRSVICRSGGTRSRVVRMALRIPGRFAAKADSFPESSYGATRVTLILADGRVVENVTLSGSDIVRVEGRDVSPRTRPSLSPERHRGRRCQSQTPVTAPRLPRRSIPPPALRNLLGSCSPVTVFGSASTGLL